MKNAMKWLVKTGTTLTATLMLSGHAYAVDSLDSCSVEITKLTQELLKANVGSDMVATIYESINEAESACANGDFASATAAIEDANSLLSTQTGN